MPGDQKKNEDSYNRKTHSKTNLENKWTYSENNDRRWRKWCAEWQPRRGGKSRE